MPDPSRDSQIGEDLQSDPGSPPKTPRWVKVFGIIAIVLLVVLVIGLITNQAGPGGGHGPGRHMPGGNPAEQRP